MSPQTNCPACGAPVDLPATTCPYCGAALKADPQSAPTMIGAAPAQPASPYANSAEAMDAVKAALRKGSKVEAVRVYREYFQVGLKEAKDAVDAAETELKLQTGAPRDDEPPAFARPEAASPVPALAMSPNSLEEPQKPAWQKWALGCGIAFLVFCCLCVCLPLVLFAFAGGQTGG
jgi:hypothetical protein